MTGRFGSVAVVRLQLGPETWRSSAPMPGQQAIDRAEEIRREVAAVGDSPALIGFEDAQTLRCAVRARDVLAVDVVATEDPSL